MEYFGEAEQRTLAVTASPRLTRSGVRRLVADIGNASPGIVFTFRRSTNGQFSFPYISPVLQRFYGISRRELALDALPVFRLIHPDDLPQVMASIFECADFQRIWSCEFRVNTPRQGEIWVEGRSVPQLEADGSVLFHGFVSDISQRKRTEMDLRRSRSLLEAFVDHAPVSIAMFDRNMCYIRSSRKWRATVGASERELIGHSHYDDVVPLSPDRIAAHQRAMAGETVCGEGDWTDAHGVRSRHYWEVHPWGDAGTETGGIIIYCQDVTQERAMEAELRHAHKMEALGQLAGGVAHDFNNFLQIIQGYTELMQERLAGDDLANKFAGEVLRAARGASSLTRQLLAFSRRQVLNMTVVDLNEVIQATSKMLKRLLSEEIEYSLDLDTTLWHVAADADQLAQVLINLCVNARDAMPGGGQLRIVTRNLAVANNDGVVHPRLPAGEFVMLSVQDSGSGIELATLEHIFEPFFTTKDAGKGTGLGLSTVYGIVRQSEGYVWAESEPGRGARFIVCLPRNRLSTRAAVPERVPVLPADRQTILVVEDDGDVLRAVADYLPTLGYQVLRAHPAEALSVASQHEKHIDILLTDVVMPGVNGPLLAEKIRAIRPEMRTVFMSGYIDDAVTRHGVLESGSPFLQKPFTMAELSDKIREALTHA